MKIKEKYYRFAEKGQQIQRVNRFLVTEYLIFYAFILFMLWASRAKGVRSLGFTAFVSVIAVVSGGALLIGWKRRPESERLRYLALIGLYLVSFFMTFAYTESFIRFLGLAPFIGCILFFDPKYSRIGGIGYLVLNALTVFGQIRQQPEGVAGTTNLVLDLLALGVLVFAVIFMQIIIPNDVLITPNFVTLSDLKLIDTKIGMMLPFYGSAMAIFLLRQHFKSIPKALAEAAKIDGANTWQTIWGVYMPCAKPAYLSFAVISVSYHWNNYLWPLIVTNSPTNRTLTVGLAIFAKSKEANMQWANVCAAAFIIIVPLLLAFLVAQKQFMSSFVSAGIKE